MYKYWKNSALNQQEFFEYQLKYFNNIFNFETLPDIMVTHYKPSNDLLELMPNNSIWNYGKGKTNIEDYICKNGNKIKLICNSFSDKSNNFNKNDFLIEI